MDIADKIAIVQETHGLLSFRPGRNTNVSAWLESILAEVAELPKYRALVHDIRAQVKERAATLNLSRR